MSLTEKNLFHIHFPIPVEPERSCDYLRNHTWKISSVCSFAWVLLTGFRYLNSGIISLGPWILSGLAADLCITVATGILLVKDVEVMKDNPGKLSRKIRPTMGILASVLVSLATAGINLSLSTLLYPVSGDVSMETGIHIFSLQMDAGIIILGLVISLIAAVRKKEMPYRGGAL